MADIDLARTALNAAINHLGVAYRVQILSVGQNKGDKPADYYLDIKVYDNVISQVGNIQIGNVDQTEKVDKEADYNYYDDLPASILEDFPETQLDRRDTISNNLKSFIENNDKNANFAEKGLTDDGYKIFHIDFDETDDESNSPILSDINQLNYDSLFTIFSGVLREMLAVTIFSVN